MYRVSIRHLFKLLYGTLYMLLCIHLCILMYTHAHTRVSFLLFFRGFFLCFPFHTYLRDIPDLGLPLPFLFLFLGPCWALEMFLAPTPSVAPQFCLL